MGFACYLHSFLFLKQKEAQHIFVLNNLMSQGWWVEFTLLLAISKGKLLTPSEAFAESSIQGGAAILKPDTEGLKNGLDSWKKSANARRREA